MKRKKKRKKQKARREEEVEERKTKREERLREEERERQRNRGTEQDYDTDSPLLAQLQGPSGLAKQGMIGWRWSGAVRGSAGAEKLIYIRYGMVRYCIRV